MKRDWTRRLAGRLADSIVLRRGQRLFEANEANWHLPLSKVDKALVAGYLGLKDYSAGVFPPRFEDRERAYQGEIDYLSALPGIDLSEEMIGAARKPFLTGGQVPKFLSDFSKLFQLILRLQLKPGDHLLELGCGSGWMSEFFALAGFNVVGSSIAPAEIQMAEKRAQAFRKRELPNTLDYLVSPMEEVHEKGAHLGKFDVAIVFEALHHAFSWKETIRSVRGCLNEGGCFIIANEPNVLHTLVSYRVAKLSNTHEIGLSQKQLCKELRAAGFERIEILEPRFNNRIAPHWIVGKLL